LNGLVAILDAHLAWKIFEQLARLNATSTMMVTAIHMHPAVTRMLLVMPLAPASIRNEREHSALSWRPTVTE
jgi:hypothetical protein